MTQPPFSGLTLTLVASLAWAGLDTVRKKLAQEIEPLALVVWITLGATPVFLVLAILDGQWIASEQYVLPAFASLVLNGLANVLFMWSVRLSPLSLTIPYLSLTPVFSTILANLMIGEALASMQKWGLGAILAGAFILAPSGVPKGTYRTFRWERGSLLMCIVALLWSCTAIFDKIALRHASVGAHALIQSCGIGVVLLLILAGQRRLYVFSQLWAHKGLCTASLLLSMTAFAVQLMAIKTVFIGFYETIKRALGMFMAIVLGRVLFRESIHWRKIVAVILFALGTALLLSKSGTSNGTT